jgi:glycosyltransferase involved in cell wall biosynthesis
MKVVAINGRFLSQPRTGVQRYAFEILSALGRIKQEKYRFICLVPSGQRYSVPAGIETFEDESPLRSGLVWQQVRLPLAVSRVGADILWNPCNIAPVLLRRRQLITVFDASVYAGPEWFNWKFRAYYRGVFSLYQNIASRIITCSEFSKGEIARYLKVPPERIDVAYGAISPEFKRTGSQAIVKGGYVLSLGSRDPRKNVAKLIAAWKTVPDSVKAGRKLVVAGGKQPTFSNEKLNEGSPDVFFTGYLEDDALPGLYSNADCLVYPSLYEGFGLPPLEAMACGCPVIVSGKASLPEVCGEAAMYVDPLSVPSIAGAISSMLTDAALREDLVAKGYENVRRFDWETSASRVLESLDKVFAG